MAKRQKNFLDYIPRHNHLFPYEKKENGMVVVRIQNRGLSKKLTQMLLKKPRYTYIELERFGSFVWEQIDGQRTIYEIGILVGEKFGREAEPLYERLAQYMHILHRNSFILYMNPNKR